MTDTEEIIEIIDTPTLSPGDVLDIPLAGEDVISTIDSSIQDGDEDLNYLGESVFDINAMAPLSQKSIVSIRSPVIIRIPSALTLTSSAASPGKIACVQTSAICNMGSVALKSPCRGTHITLCRPQRRSSCGYHHARNEYAELFRTRSVPRRQGR